MKTKTCVRTGRVATENPYPTWSPYDDDDEPVGVRVERSGRHRLIVAGNLGQSSCPSVRLFIRPSVRPCRQCVRKCRSAVWVCVCVRTGERAAAAVHSRGSKRRSSQQVGSAATWPVVVTCTRDCDNDFFFFLNIYQYSPIIIIIIIHSIVRWCCVRESWRIILLFFY